jgi:hypothetical protein
LGFAWISSLIVSKKINTNRLNNNWYELQTNNKMFAFFI